MMTKYLIVFVFSIKLFSSSIHNKIGEAYNSYDH